MNNGKLIKNDLPNYRDYMSGEPTRKWSIYLGDKFQDLFDKYTTKAAAVADAKKYGIKLN